MTKLRSLDEFENFLNDEISWRKKEISELRGLVSGSESAFRDTLIRASLALLYAHWEGFVKSAAEAYLQFMSEQVNRLQLHDKLSDHFHCLCLWYSLRSAIQKFGGDSRRPSQFVQAARMLVPFRGTAKHLPHEDIIDTRSNLSFEVLREITTVLDLPYQDFQAKEKLIDDKLLKNRNDIVHGKKVMPAFEDFDQTEREILLLMTGFKGMLEGAALGRLYLQRPAQAS